MLKNERVEFQVDRIDDLAAAASGQTTKDGSSCWIFLFSYFCLLFSFFLEFFSVISLNKFKLCSPSFVHIDHVFNYCKSRCDELWEWGEVKFYPWKKSSQKDISQLRRELIFHKFCLNTFKRIYFLIEHWMTRTNVMLCKIWNHLHNLKNVRNTHGGVLFLVKL